MTIKVTFPDGAVRDYAAWHDRDHRGRGHLHQPRQKDRRHEVERGAVGPVRSARGRRQHRIRHARQRRRARADPPRRRARPRRGGAGTVAGDAGHHRPGDRERLLLRLQARHAVLGRRFPDHRKEDGRDHRARRRLHQGSVDPRRGQARLCRQGRELQGRAGRRHSGRPDDQDLQAGPVVRPLPRPAHALDQGCRHGVQADQGGRRLLARRQQQSGAVAASTARPSPRRRSSTSI